MYANLQSQQDIGEIDRRAGMVGTKLTDKSTRHFKSLDGWRGICAIGVALYHFPPVFFGADLPLFRSGWLFVDFFFVLSGFVITHTYVRRLQNPTEMVRFIGKRFFRLYPLHLFTFLIFLGWLLVFDSSRIVASLYFNGFHLTNLFADLSFGKIALHFGLMQGFHERWIDTGFNVPSWSISVEFWTYILFAALCLTLRPVLWGQFCIAAICLFILYHVETTHWYLNLLRCLDGFAMGSIVYLLLQNRNYCLNRIVMTMLELVAIAAVAALLWAAPFAEAERGGVLWISPLIFAAVVAVFSFEAGLFSSLLQRGTFQEAGRLSYSIYLNHNFIIGLIMIAKDAAFRVLGFDLSSWRSVGTAVVVAFIPILWTASRWTYEHVELPGQALWPYLRGRSRHFAVPSPSQDR